MDKIDTKKHLKMPHLELSKYAGLVGREPHVDWAIIFSVSVIIGALLIGWGVSRFGEVRSINYAQDKGSAPAEGDILKPQQFIDISKEFESKRLRTLELEKGQVYTPDPSVL